MDQGPRRRRIPGIVIVLVCIPVSLGLIALVLRLWIHNTEVRRWEEMRTQLAELARETRSRDPSRPVLRGTPVPGNGWQDYEPALLSLKGMSWSLIGDFLSGSPKADRAKVQAWVTQHAAALQGLRRGVVRTSGQRDIDWESTPRWIYPFTALGALARCEARFLAGSGKEREAAELLLDAGQFGADSARNGTLADALTGAFVLSSALDDLKPIILSGSLRQADLLQIDRELDLLDRSSASEGDAYVNDAMLIGFSFLRSGDVETFMKTFFGENRTVSARWFGFSDRIMMVDAFETYLRLMQRLRAATQEPWRDASRINFEAMTEWQESSNPLLRDLHDIYGYSKPPAGAQKTTRDSYRERRTQLRLLRAAAHYRATGEILELADPFGEKLLSSRKGNRVTLWSIGGDGTDDGGVGDWKRGGRDIVLDVER